MDYMESRVIRKIADGEIGCDRVISQRLAKEVIMSREVIKRMLASQSSAVVLLGVSAAELDACAAELRDWDPPVTE